MIPYLLISGYCLCIYGMMVYLSLSFLYEAHMNNILKLGPVIINKEMQVARLFDCIMIIGRGDSWKHLDEYVWSFDRDCENGCFRAHVGFFIIMWLGKDCRGGFDD